MRVSVYLGNDWELSHFNTLMFVAISVMWLQRMQRALQSTCDDDSQIVSQLVKLFVSVEYNSYEFFSWVTLQCLLTNWFNSQWKKFHHKNCIFIAAIFIFIPRWFPVSACSLPAQLLALYCSYHPLCSMQHGSCEHCRPVLHVAAGTRPLQCERPMCVSPLAPELPGAA